MESKVQKQRFRFQVRLRTVLVFVTVFCIGCWLFTSQFRHNTDDEEDSWGHFVPRQPPPDGVSFRASVDSQSYRLGDPIRLDVELKNDSTNIYRLIMPRVPSSSYPTMAFGVRSTRGTEIVMDLKPSAFYVGSYFGPPRFEGFLPGDVYRSSVCLQHFAHLTATELRDGNYQLTLAFDSSKFAGVNPKGLQIACRFDATPVSFSIKGPARTDPLEILRVIGEKTGIESIADDIVCSDWRRQERAREAVWNYGDGRLTPFLRKQFGLSAGDLEILYPFVRPKRR